jgi:hypothetical protein
VFYRSNFINMFTLIENITISIATCKERLTMFSIAFGDITSCANEAEG